MPYGIDSSDAIAIRATPSQLNAQSGTFNFTVGIDRGVMQRYTGVLPDGDTVKPEVRVELGYTEFSGDDEGEFIVITSVDLEVPLKGTKGGVFVGQLPALGSTLHPAGDGRTGTHPFLLRAQVRHLGGLQTGAYGPGDMPYAHAQITVVGFTAS